MAIHFTNLVKLNQKTYTFCRFFAKHFYSYFSRTYKMRYMQFLRNERFCLRYFTICDHSFCSSHKNESENVHLLLIFATSIYLFFSHEYRCSYKGWTFFYLDIWTPPPAILWPFILLISSNWIRTYIPLGCFFGLRYLTHLWPFILLISSKN